MTQNDSLLDSNVVHLSFSPTARSNMSSGPGKNGDGGGVFLTIRPRDTGASAKEFDSRHFLIDELVSKLVGAVESASVDPKTGHYVIKVRSETQAERLCRAQKLGDGFKIKIERCTQLNRSRVVIRSEMIASTTDRDLLKQLSKQGVTEVRAMSANLTTRLLTFKSASAPKTVKIGLIPTPTERYYPPPIKCWNCLRLGHTKASCTGKRRCARCSGTHMAQECQNPPSCINCNGDHKPSDRACPAFLQERRIMKIQVDTGCSAKAARREYRKSNRSVYYREIADSALEATEPPVEPDGPTVPSLPVEPKTPEVQASAAATEESLSDGEIEMVTSKDSRGNPIIPRPIGSGSKQRKAASKRSAKAGTTSPRVKSAAKPGGSGKGRLRLPKQKTDFQRACEELTAAAARKAVQDDEPEAAPPAKRMTFSDVSSEDEREHQKT